MINVFHDHAAAIQALSFFRPFVRRSDFPLNVAAISRLRDEAEHIQNAINALKPQLETLEDRLAAIQHDLSSVVYPVNSLPAEILGRMFEVAMDSVPPHEINRTRFRITAVCRLWRDIAIAHPHVWTRIYPPRRTLNSSSDSLFDDSLQHARGLPLEFSLPRHSRPPRFLFNSAAQWAVASVESTPWSRFASHDHRIECPRLTKLVIDLQDFTRPNQYYMELDTPNLRELSIRTPTYLTGPYLSFPRHQLKKLTIRQSATYEELLPLLAELVGLEELVIASAFNWGGSVDPKFEVTPVLMPHLSTLLLGALTNAYLLKYVDLPALTTLELADFDAEEIQLVISCIVRSGARITTLSLMPTIYADLKHAFLSPAFSPVTQLLVTAFNMRPSKAQQCAADLARLDTLPNLAAFTLHVAAGRRQDRNWDRDARDGLVSLEPFLEGVASRAANALQAVGHGMPVKLTKLCTEFSAPSRISSQDMRGAARLQRILKSLSLCILQD
ncbi:hypothetical protein MIND_00581800 [Mycena indigotica]|uniref:F-box domain-containing protein n=1 Tax=Mycena indigotica TaxID=2126181 RepID=A0A8H6W5F5_9AGAR|nr:uncharacterized protein MIND_00581800 [Mycena indigotica]KAF7303526.1 hypothetical protein MIND_00581800 [Mycena indigotica]